MRSGSTCRAPTLRLALREPGHKKRRLSSRRDDLHWRPAVDACAGSGGLDGVTLGNNHVLDAGTTGLNETMRHLDAAGIAYTGAGMDLAEARKPMVFDLGGRRSVSSHTLTCLLRLGLGYPDGPGGATPSERLGRGHKALASESRPDPRDASLGQGVHRDPRTATGGSRTRRPGRRGRPRNRRPRPLAQGIEVYEGKPIFTASATSSSTNPGRKRPRRGSSLRSHCTGRMWSRFARPFHYSITPSPTSSCQGRAGIERCARSSPHPWDPSSGRPPADTTFAPLGGSRISHSAKAGSSRRRRCVGDGLLIRAAGNHMNVRRATSVRGRRAARL